MLIASSVNPTNNTVLPISGINVAIGTGAGSVSQGERSVAVGAYAGKESQGSQAIAVGDSAGKISQGSFAVAVGNELVYSTKKNHIENKHVFD